MSAPLRVPAAALAATALCVGCTSALRDAPAPDPVPPPRASTASAAATTRSAATEPAPGVPASAADAPVVLLDPGHNGGNAAAPAAINRQVPDGRGGTKPCNTTGTATGAGYPEHALTWDLAQRIRAQLQRHGIVVVLTRPDDRGAGPCVDERGEAGARAGAAAAVSLHADGAAPGGRGFHVAYSDPPLNPAQAGPARRLAASLRDALRGHRFAPADYIGEDGLDGRDDLGGLNAATVPTALVECANMRNPAEAQLVTSPSGRERYAGAVTAGVLRFLGR